MNKKTIWGVVGVVIVIIALVLFLGGTKNNTPIKIGISTVLSGDFAAAGQNMVSAAKLAIKGINDSGGINGRPVELLVEDAGWDSKTGLNAAQKLINIDGVKYIVGGTSSNGTLASAPLVNEKRVIYMTPVTGGSNVDNAGEYIFRTANSDLLAGRDIATAISKLGYMRVGVIAEVTEYTLDLKKSFEEKIKSTGGSLVISEEFQPGTTDFKTLVAKFKAARPQAIFVASQTGVGGAHFMKQARDAGLSVVYFSDFTFVTNGNAKKIIGSFEGVYFADPSYDSANPKTVDFIKNYQDTYKTTPLIPFHALSTYDDIMLMSQAIKAVGDNSVKVHDWLLANTKDYHGLMGVYSLDEKGNSDLGFDIKIVKDGKFIKI